MAKTTYLTFYIVLTDAAQVAAYQAQYPKGVNRAPFNAAVSGGAAVEFAAPWTTWRVTPGGPPPPAAPYTWSPWTGASGGGSDTPFPIDVATFTRKSGGIFGIGGTTTKYYWIGEFVLAPRTDAAPEDAAPGVTVYIPQRRWVEGFDIPGNICGLATSNPQTRDASRHTDGFGLALRGGSTSTNVLLSAFGLGTPTATWDRIYVRWRNGGSAPFPFMRWHAAPSAGAGALLAVMPTGQLALLNGLAASSPVLLGTYGQLTLDKWTKVDIVTQFNNGAGGTSGHLGKVEGQKITQDNIAVGVVNGASTIVVSGDGLTGGGPFVITDHDTSSAKSWVIVANDLGVFDVGKAAVANKTWSTGTLGGGIVQLWINGESVATVAVSPSDGGLGTAGQTLASIDVGNVSSAASDDTEIDLDDWISSALPVDSTGNVNYGGVDFTQGSKVRLIRPTGFGGAHANWTGDFRILLQNGIGAYTKAALTSATSGAVLEATTDYTPSILQDGQSLGPVAMQVTLHSLRGGAPSGTLGYQIGAAAAVDTAITQPAAFSTNAVMYRPVNGTKLPTDWVSVLLRHTKAADTTTGQAATLLAQVEMVGTFFDEDIPWRVDPKPTLPHRVGIHNAPYDRTPWGQGALAAPNAPVIITAGTYTGNATGQELSFRAPVHWLFVRNAAAGTQPGGLWWTSLLAAHRNTRLGVEPAFAVQQYEDQTFVPAPGQDSQQQRFRIRIAGADAASNANATTYQFVAVSDPGGRFLLNMAQTHRSSLAVYRAALIDAGFTPEWAFFAFEDLTNTSSTQTGVKGPGHATESVTQNGGTTTTLALAFSAGAITGKAVFWALVGHLQVAFSLWRRHDGNNDPGEAAVFAIGSYTGDGSASRTITPGTAGKRPLFAIVQPENAVGIVRDPSHTGTTSQIWNGGTANTTTGITGGAPDSLSVGTTLNNNGVVHHYFILWGGTTAGNGGFSANGEFIPVEASPPATGPWPPDPTEDDFTPPPDDSTPTPAPVSEPDLAAACVPTTQKVVNVALAHIGVSKQIADLVNELSQEAVTSRLHIKDDVEAVLYRFPWRRAKRYANLVLVGGTATVPVNNDWQYSYRAPSDMVRVRRITSQTGTKRQYDPNPIAFEVGSDATGDLIFTDAVATVDVPVQLEYTARLTCPAAQLGQPFRDALAWKHAASLAPALSKDPQKAQYCEAKYRDVVITTDVIDAAEEQPQKPGDGDAPWITGR